MPFRALVDDKELIAPYLSDEEWESLRYATSNKKTLVTLPCCQGEGRLRKSKLGTKHFFHKPNSECEYRYESYQHLKAKLQILEGCKESGFNAVSEAYGENWRADVLVTRGNARIAFEVQWSPQTWEETEFRQDRYRQDGVTGVWFFRKIPKGLAETKREFPVFQIYMDEYQSIKLKLNKRDWYLDDFVKSLLEGKIQFRHHLTPQPKQYVSIMFRQYDCWKCRKPYHVYFLKNDPLSHCFQEVSANNSLMKYDYALWPEVHNLVSEFIRSKEGNRLKIGRVRNHLDDNRNVHYKSFRCYWCGAIYKGHFFTIAESDTSYNQKIEPEKINTFITLKHTFRVERPHWCTSESSQFC